MARPFVRTALVCLAAAACGGPDPDRPAGGPASANPIVTIAYADPRARTQGGGIDVIVGLLSDQGIIVTGRDGRPQPRLAERWEVSADGLTWRITLRRDLVFHDNEPITSTAVRAVLAPSPDANEADAPVGLRDLVAVEAPTTHEVVLRLKRPNAFLLESLSQSLAPVVSSKASAAGPFQLVARTPGKATLKRFDRYYRGRPPLEGITIAEYPSQREAWSAMLRGDVDVLYNVSPEAFEFVKESPTAHVATFLRPYVTALTFNVAHPQLGRREVRRALNMAIDRRLLIESAAGGRGVPATDHIWPKHWARDAAAPTFAFDPAAAAAMLDAAGLRRKTGKGPPTRLTFTCLVPSEPKFERLALLIQRQLLSVDVDMRLEALTLPEFGQRVAGGRFDVFLQELVSGYGLGFTHLWWHSKPPNPLLRTGYSGANRVLDQLRAARTDDDTRSAVHALQRTMNEDPPAAFLYWDQASRAVSSRFVLPESADEDIMRSVDRWQLAGGAGRRAAVGGSPGAASP